MTVFENYENCNWFLETGYYHFFRAENAGKKVILKLLKEEYALEIELKKIRHEYHILSELAGQGAAATSGIFSHKKTFFLELEDIGGQSLGILYSNKRPSTEEFVSLARSVLAALRQVHEKNIIHRDINPSNIILNETTKVVKFIDFGIATKSSAEKMQFKSIDKLEGTLSYISPEQTGRTNKILDYRSDFYSLGITFFKLITGVLPFFAEDPLDLVHAHISKPPAHPSSMNADIPKMLGSIIIKMIAKDPEDRYQSIQGILLDLEEFLNRHRKGDHANFELGKNDLSEKFSMPDKLYGRSEVLAHIRQHIYEANDFNWVTISGPSGIGKSSLGDSLREVLRDCEFAYGKFENLEPSIPYQALTQAFRDVILRVLSKSEDEIHEYQNRIREAISPNEQVLCDIIAELSSIIQDPKPVPKLSIEKEKSRFENTLLKFVLSLAKGKKRLVLFLDDFQVSDTNSIEFLRLLTKSGSNLPIAIILAVRSDDPRMPKANEYFVKDVQREKNCLKIDLSSLTVENIAELIHESTGSSANFLPLAEVCRMKTEGNPFFVKQFLLSLIKNSHIRYNGQAHSWDFDLEKIRKMQITENVIDLLAQRAGEFNADEIQVFGIAALIGRKFNSHILKTLSQKSDQEISAYLSRGFKEGVILLGDRNEEQESYGNALTCKFAHEKIREAFYDRIDDQIKVELNFAIAQYLINAPIPKKQNQDFQIAYHANLAKEKWLQSTDLLYELARINYNAGVRAKRTIAYETASEYFKSAINALPTTSWQNNYQLCFDIYRSYGESRFLLQDYINAKKAFDYVVSKCQNKYDLAMIYYSLSNQYVAKAEYDRAIYVGMKALALFGISLPDFRDDKALLEEFKHASNSLTVKLNHRKFSELRDLPKMTDRNQQEIIKNFAVLADAAILANIKLFHLIASLGVNICVQYGNSELSPLMYTFLAITYQDVHKDPEHAKELFDLASSLNESGYQDINVTSKMQVYTGFYLNHWFNPPLKGIAISSRGMELGLELGEILNAAYASVVPIQLSFFAGSDLNEVLSFCNQSNELSKSKQMPLVAALTFPTKKLCEHLMDDKADGGGFKSENFDEAEFLRQWQHVKMVAQNYAVRKMQASFFAGHYQMAFEQGEKILPWISACSSQLITLEFHVYFCLSSFFTHGVMDEDRKKILLLTADSRHYIENTTQLNPSLHFLTPWIKAEIYRLEGDYLSAMRLFASTMQSCQKAKATSFLAVLYLRTAELYQNDTGNNESFEVYMRKAYRAVKKWGALGMAAKLELRFPKIRFKKEQTDRLNAFRSTVSVSLNSIDIDVENLVRASNIITSEIKLSHLIDRLVEISTKSAGADKGVLLLVSGNELLVAMKNSSEEYDYLPLDQYHGLPHSVVQFVRRAKKMTLIHNFKHAENFNQDPYIREVAPKSILCLPLIKQNEVVGVFYLENRITKYAFTEKSVRMVTLLMSNVASAIENAQLYRTLENRVEERTSEVLKAQTKLIDSAKMAALGEMAAGIAHEINNPITIIEGYCRRINWMVEKPDTKEKVQADCEKILAMITRIAKIVYSLRTFSQDHSKDEFAKVDICEVIESTLSFCRERFAAKKIEVNVTPATEDAGIVVSGNRSELSQVVLNLLLNAFDAISDLPEKFIHIDAKKEGDQAILVITDSGPSIPPHVASEIFKPFFTTKEVGKGTGLGLSIASGIIRSHHGEIRLDQKCPNTRFVISLPLAEIGQQVAS